VASLWLALPERRVDAARRTALREATRAAAAALSKTLGTVAATSPGQRRGARS
jgi:hypothetical protein